VGLIRERKYGVGFVDRVIADEAANWSVRARALARSSATRGASVPDRTNGWLTSVYTAAYYFWLFTGELKIPAEIKT